MDNINDIISNLTADDIDMLKGVAQSILANGSGEAATGNTRSENAAPPQSTPPRGSQSQSPARQLQLSNALSSIGKDEIDMMLKAKSIFEKMNSTSNKNTDLILALKPHLSPQTQGRADAAIKILKLFDILPFLKELF
ncbi:MAG: hypothetical protein LUH82_02515 [Clostridiales bacterium]|nr:hypothetical protein [Clostridiales bacterium]